MIKISTIAFIAFLMCSCMEPGQLFVLDEDTVLEENETQSVMRDMAAIITTIEDSIVANITVAQRHHIVLSELRKLGQLAKVLEPDDVVSSPLSTPESHAAIKEYIGNLSIEVDRAIIEVSQSSPDYYLAGRIAGACLACHQEYWVSH